MNYPTESTVTTKIPVVILPHTCIYNIIFYKRLNFAQKSCRLKKYL